MKAVCMITKKGYTKEIYSISIETGLCCNYVYYVCTVDCLNLFGQCKHTVL